MLFLRVFQEIKGTRGGDSASRGRYWFPFSFSFFIFTGVDTGVRDPELVILEGAVGSVQAVSFQTA